jgi:orotate phosphoribosyltransferase
MSRAHQLAENLLQIKAIKLSPQNPFVWASGIKSPIYCDNRLTLSHPSVRNLILEGFKEILVQYSHIDAIAGVATAGIPHGAILAHELNLPFVYVRDAAKKHGRQNQLEGELKNHSKVILIEDLISTGGSSLAAAHYLQDQEHEVLAIAAIFSYQLEEGIENFKNANIALHTITNYPILLEVAHQLGAIHQKDLELLQAWRSNPKNWN